MNMRNGGTATDGDAQPLAAAPALALDLGFCVAALPELSRYTEQEKIPETGDAPFYTVIGRLAEILSQLNRNSVSPRTGRATRFTFPRAYGRYPEMFHADKSMSLPDVQRYPKQLTAKELKRLDDVRFLNLWSEWLGSNERHTRAELEETDYLCEETARDTDDRIQGFYSDHHIDRRLQSICSGSEAVFRRAYPDDKIWRPEYELGRILGLLVGAITHGRYMTPSPDLGGLCLRAQRLIERPSSPEWRAAAMAVMDDIRPRERSILLGQASRVTTDIWDLTRYASGEIANGRLRIPEAQCAADAQARQVVVGGAPEGDASPVAGKARPPLSDSQMTIMEELAGQGLTRKELARKTEIAESTVRDNLRDLRQKKLVDHDRKVGYYRPDKPPTTQ